MKKTPIEIENQIIDLYVNKKLSTVQIGKVVKLSPTGIKKILIRNKISIRNISESKIGIKRGTIFPIYKIIRLYIEDNKNSLEISKIIGCSKYSVLKILKDNNIERHKPGWKNHKHPQTKNIIKQYNSGIGMKEVAKKLKLSYQTVRYVLLKNNLVRTNMKGKGKLGKPGKPWTISQRNNFYLTKTGLTFQQYIQNIPIYKKYKQIVIFFTNKQDLSILTNYNKRGKTGKNTYQLDHKYSILEGFKNNINPQLIGNINNLEMLPWKDNIKKQNKCSITLKELQKLTNHTIPLYFINLP